MNRKIYKEVRRENSIKIKITQKYFSEDSQHSMFFGEGMILL